MVPYVKENDALGIDSRRLQITARWVFRYTIEVLEPGGILTELGMMKEVFSCVGDIHVTIDYPPR